VRGSCQEDATCFLGQLLTITASALYRLAWTSDAYGAY
jgi:hypothetical protein